MSARKRQAVGVVEREVAEGCSAAVGAGDRLRRPAVESEGPGAGGKGGVVGEVAGETGVEGNEVQRAVAHRQIARNSLVAASRARAAGLVDHQVVVGYGPAARHGRG